MLQHFQQWQCYDFSPFTYTLFNKPTNLACDTENEHILQRLGHFTRKRHIEWRQKNQMKTMFCAYILFSLS